LDCILGWREKHESKNCISNSAENVTFVTSKLHATFCKHWFFLGASMVPEVFDFSVFVSKSFEVGLATLLVVLAAI
jgi:Na+/melibiose symporter-like transporter